MHACKTRSYTIIIDGNNYFVSTMMGVLSNNPNNLYNVKHDDPRTDPRYGLFLHCLMAGIEHFCQTGIPVPQDLIKTNINICFDGSNNWRKNVFPNYKAVRKARRKSEEFDWNYFYNLMDCLREDILKALPIYYACLDGFEADDIIALSVLRYPNENWVIVSADKDMMQLLTYANIYNPRRKVFYKKTINTNQDGYDLFEHIVKGDPGDGIPNILSDDDVFINPSKRNVRITTKKLEQIQDDLYVLFKSRKWDDIKNFSSKYPYLHRNLDLIYFRYAQDNGRYDRISGLDRTFFMDYKQGNTAALFHKYGLNKLLQSAFWQNVIEE